MKKTDRISLLKGLGLLLLTQGIFFGTSTIVQAQTPEEEANIRKLEAEAATAEAQLEKLQVEIEQLKLNLPDIDTDLAPEGNVEFSETQVNLFENNVAVDRSLENLASRFNDKLEASCISDLVVLGETEQQKLKVYEQFTTTHNLLLAGYQRETGSTESGGLEFLSIPGLVAESLTKTLAFFKKDVKFFPGTVTITENDFVAELVDDAIDNPLDFSQCDKDVVQESSEQEEGDEVELPEGLSGISGSDDAQASSNDEGKKLRIYNPELFVLNSVGLSGQIPGYAEIGIIEPLSALFNQRNANKDSKNSAIVALNEQTDKLLGSLYAVENDTSMFSILADASRIKQLQEDGAKLVLVGIESATNTKTSNSIFGSGKKHAGGVRINYQIVNEDGSVLLADNMYEFSGYEKLDEATFEDEN